MLLLLMMMRLCGAGHSDLLFDPLLGGRVPVVLLRKLLQLIREHLQAHAFDLVEGFSILQHHNGGFRG